MWEKIKIFFKKFWGVVFVPVGLLLAHLFFRSSKAPSKKEIKEIKKEIKEDVKVVEEKVEEIKVAGENMQVAQQQVEAAKQEVKKQIKQNTGSKKVRDEKASKYFTNL